MVQKAAIAFMGRSADVPPELQGFLRFRAGLEKRELRGDEPVAILRIGDTGSHHALFLDGADIKSIREELEGIEAELDPEARKALQSRSKAEKG
jgi:hypothetical protein